MKKILVVDDISVNIEATRNILKHYLPEYEVISALSGMEGLELAHRELPEVILLDYLMPNMNGFEVAQKLKEDDRTRKIPVLMVSALGDNSDVRTEGLNAGADAFISKPFDIREFVALVNVMLRIKNAEDLLRKRNEDLEVFIKKQTQHYLDSEERFFQISKHVREFFWEVDSEFVFTFVSKSVEPILGHNLAWLMGKTRLYDLAQNTNDASYKDEIIDYLKMQMPFEDKEFSFFNKNGSTVWLSMSGVPMFDDQQHFTGYRGVCYDITRRKEAETQLNRSMQEIRNYQRKLKKLNRELTMAEEKERKRIAEYLHDGIGQTLSLAFMNLSSVTNGSMGSTAKKTLKNTARFINSAIQEARLLTYDLSPPVLYEFGFLPAVKWKLEQTAEKFNIETHYTDNGISTHLDAESSISLYRIVCELITNTIKHANASMLSFEVNQHKNGYKIEVKDDGIGFDPENREGPGETDNFGLFSIHERLDALNGSINITSLRDKGTRAEIFIPELKN